MNTTLFSSQILAISDKLFRLARSILKNDVIAQDAVQDLNMKLWEKRDQLDKIDNLQSFSLRSMRNLCFDYMRQRKLEIEISPDLHFEEPNPYQQIEQIDTVTHILEMINNLPELQRTIIRLRDVEGLEITDIADITNCTVNAVTVNLSRARKKIRDQIISEDYFS
jgi:RNA polymerase sigma-70 factor, ECF subfamily